MPAGRRNPAGTVKMQILKGERKMGVKLGICNFCVPGTGVFAPRLVAEAGLDGMSIEFGTYEKGFPLSSRRLQELYLEEAQRYAIEYCNIGCSGFDFIPFHAKKDDPIYDVVKYAATKAVEAAAFMKIPLVFVPAFHASEIKSGEQFARAVEMLQYMCDLAAQYGIQIGSENAMGTQNQIHLCESVDRANFGLFYDSDNLFYNRGFDQKQMLVDLYDYLVPQLHVKDGTKSALAGSLLGEGESGFFDVMQVLKERRYSGWIIIENLYEQRPLRDAAGDVFEIYRKDVEILKKASSEIR